MNTIALAGALLVASINYSTSKSITLCTGTMGLRGHPSTDLMGHPETSGSDLLPVNRTTTVALPAPFSSSMYCSVTEMLRRGKGAADLGRKSSAGYYRIVSCGEKTSKFITVAITETDDKGWERAGLSLMEPRLDGSGAIFRIDVVCGTDPGEP